MLKASDNELQRDKLCLFSGYVCCDAILCVGKSEVGVLQCVCVPTVQTNTGVQYCDACFFCLKIIEWYDTLVLVVRGKPVSWLHYLHHMTTAIITGLNQDSAMASMTVLTNTFVHALMYAYYCRPWRAVRRWVTRIQIIQHAACVASGIYVLATADCRRANSTLAILAGLAGYIMYLTMFLNFYFKSRTQ